MVLGIGHFHAEGFEQVAHLLRRRQVGEALSLAHLKRKRSSRRVRLRSMSLVYVFPKTSSALKWGKASLLSFCASLVSKYFQWMALPVPAAHGGTARVRENPAPAAAEKKKGGRRQEPEGATPQKLTLRMGLRSGRFPARVVVGPAYVAVRGFKGAFRPDFSCSAVPSCQAACLSIPRQCVKAMNPSKSSYLWFSESDCPKKPCAVCQSYEPFQMVSSYLWFSESKRLPICFLHT